MNNQDTENEAVIAYLPKKWDKPASQSTVESCRREMLQQVTVCAAIKNMKSEPSFAFYVVEDDEICENVVSHMAAAGEFIESDTVDMMWVDIDFDFIEDEAYDQQIIIDPDNASNPTCAIDVSAGIEDKEVVMEIVVAIVGIGSEEDEDGNTPFFILLAQADFGDGEGYLSVIKTVYDEYGNGMFEKSDIVKVYRVQVTMDEALDMGGRLRKLLPCDVEAFA